MRRVAGTRMAGFVRQAGNAFLDVDAGDGVRLDIEFDQAGAGAAAVQGQ